MPWLWLSLSKQILFRSFKWGTLRSCRSKGHKKKTRGQTWRSKRKLLIWPNSTLMHPGSAEPADFLSTSNFDLWYFCSLLIYKDAQYLIWKIWFISVWSLKPKAVVWLLTGFMLGQSTLISYHTEANGCIFFAAGVFRDDFKHGLSLLKVPLFHIIQRPLLKQKLAALYILKVPKILQRSIIWG